jgi:hypothetical protein
MNFASHIIINVIAEIQCTGCGETDDCAGGTEGEAERELIHHLKTSGWEMVDGDPYCPVCARARHEG